MGKLSGITYRVLAKKMREFGFQFFREAKGSHEIWHNEDTDRYTTIPKHSGDMAEGTVRSILKQADIEIDDFLS
jgi:predicted RNA binding protein YcfA (HicA-like mRNA interferase family)